MMKKKKKKKKKKKNNSKKQEEGQGMLWRERKLDVVWFHDSITKIKCEAN